MPRAGSVAKSGATCLACIPLRMGVFIASVLTIIGSFAIIYLKENYAVQARLLVGGYTALSTLFGKYVDYVGCVWGIFGILGCWQMKEEYLKIYNYYNMFRLATWCFILYKDFPLLQTCEEWTLDLDGARKRHGWNPTMYAVANAGTCVPTRFYFNVFVSTGVVLFLYLTFVNIQLQNLLNEEPAYILRLPGQKMDSSYYAYSLGERTALLGQRTDRRGDLPIQRPETQFGKQTSAHNAKKPDAQNKPSLEPLWDEEEGDTPVHSQPWDSTVQSKAPVLYKPQPVASSKH